MGQKIVLDELIASWGKRLRQYDSLKEIANFLRQIQSFDLASINRNFILAN